MIPLQLKLGLGAAVFAGVFWAGWEWRDRAADAQLLAKDNQIAALRLQAQEAATEASEQAREIERLTQDRIALAAELDALRNQEREVVERIVEKEVIRYVQDPDHGQLVLPGEWVRIHDIAAVGAGSGLPGPAFPSAGSYADAARVTDADSIAVIADNYGTCHAISDQLQALQAWVRAAF